MTKIKNVPNVVPLDDESVFCLSIVCAWHNLFPSTLRDHARLSTHRLHHALESREISAYGLLSAAYIGFAPLATNYARFIAQAERINKLEPNPAEFRKNDAARENSAASEFGVSRGELKRLFKGIDELAIDFRFASYDAIFNCREQILHDQSPFAPADRETYANGPLHLWDFAKAVNEYKLVEMSFGTFNEWVLFVHLEEGVVSGHAIHTLAHRFGNFAQNPLIDNFELRMRGDSPSAIIQVPQEVQEAARELADRRFPERPFKFVPPPMMYLGSVVPSKMICPDLRRAWMEG